MLPKIDLPTFELKLPITKTRILYRPFLVKEEKVLLMAAQGKDIDEINRSVMQTVTNCVIDSGKTKIEDLPSVEIDLLFLHMRGKSIGGTIKQEFACNNVVEGSKCGYITEVDISVNDAFLTDGPKSDVIKLSDKLSLKMKYPKFKTYDMEKEGYEYDILIDCMDYVFDNDKVYKFKEQTREENIEFIEGLTKDKFMEIQAFYDSIPELIIKKPFTCSKCGFQHVLELVDPLDFF